MIATAVLGLSVTAAKADIYWDSNVADWEAADSWQGREVPTAESVVHIGHYGLAHVQSAIVAEKVYIGTSGSSSGTLRIGPSGSLIATSIAIGAGGSEGTLLVDGGKVKVLSRLALAPEKNAVGIIRVLNGGRLNVAGNLTITPKFGIGKLLINKGEVKTNGVVISGSYHNKAKDSLYITTDGVLDTNFIQYGFVDAGTATIHLDGGRIETGSINGLYGKQSLHINGGTIRAKDKAEENLISGFHDGFLVVNIKGGTIDTNGCQLALVSPFQGRGGLDILSSKGNGILKLQSVQKYTGLTYIGKNVTVRQEVTGSLNRQANVGVDSGGIFDLGGHDGAINGLFGEANSKIINSSPLKVVAKAAKSSGRGEKKGEMRERQLDSPSENIMEAADLTVGSANGHGIFAGDIVEENGGGRISLTKVGVGEQHLLGKNT